MGENMIFPNEIYEFIKSYSFFDDKKVYTNGSELISVFRVLQMLEHYYGYKSETAHSESNSKWIEGLDGSCMCPSCKKVFRYLTSNICPICGNENSYE